MRKWSATKQGVYGNGDMTGRRRIGLTFLIQSHHLREMQNKGKSSFAIYFYNSSLRHSDWQYNLSRTVTELKLTR